jgi:hypothetical protein
MLWHYAPGTHKGEQEMVRHRIAALAFLTMTVGTSLTASGQGRPDPTLIAAQREAMVPLAFMDGVWRGPAWTILASGEKHTITQTERIGPFLDDRITTLAESCSRFSQPGLRRTYLPSAAEP